MAGAKQDERTAFWDAYGPRNTSLPGAWRSPVYKARHLGAIRLERHRLGNADGVRESYVSPGKTLRAWVSLALEVLRR
ncbi:hypothetical protein ABT288_30985 [Streptomyces sp. NPDC001093]|uniref:hypothetical protein n=1 Tax=Streptomyces sp. NPDC001093 TaxID=3154376 RepID=UPI00332D24FE